MKVLITASHELTEITLTVSVSQQELCQIAVSRMTDGKSETWSLNGMSVGDGPGLQWRNVLCPYCSHRKCAVAKG